MKKSAFFCITIACLLWGTSSIFVYFLSPLGLTSIQMTAVRTVVSSIFLAVYTLLFDRNLFKIKLKDIPIYIGAGLSLFLTGTAYYFSMQATSVSTAVILMYTAPIFVMCYSVIFLGETLTKLKTLSVILMLLGCCFVSGVVGGLKYNTFGLFMGLISGLSYSSYNILAKVAMRRNIPPLTATMYCYIFAMIISLITSSPANIITVIKNTPYSIVLMIALGIFTSALPYFLYTIGLKHLPAGTASSLGIIEPLAATLYSVVFFKEPLNVYKLAGFFLIIGAILLLNYSENKIQQYIK